MHEQPKIINQINVNVVSVIPNVNNLNSAYKLLRHFSQMGYMSESKAILTFPPPPPPTVFSQWQLDERHNIVWGGGMGMLGRESLLFPFWSKYGRQYFRLIVEDKVFLVVFSSIVRIRLWLLTHISTTLWVFITRVLLYKLECHPGTVPVTFSSCYRPFLWGPAAASHHQVSRSLGPSLWQQPSVTEVLELLDAKKMGQSTILFPQTRLLQVCEGLDHLRFLFELAEGSFLLFLYFHAKVWSGLTGRLGRQEMPQSLLML